MPRHVIPGTLQEVFEQLKAIEGWLTEEVYEPSMNLTDNYYKADDTLLIAWRRIRTMRGLPSRLSDKLNQRAGKLHELLRAINFFRNRALDVYSAPNPRYEHYRSPAVIKRFEKLQDRRDEARLRCVRLLEELVAEPLR